MADIRFDNRVAIVTGAGGGLGRSHALLLASRGAKVVVNDLGGSVDGSGEGAKKAADKVVDEIKAAGGEAVANYDGVDTMAGAESIVKTAKDAFGKLDIVINNAGILRDVSFVKLTEQDWEMVLKVHLYGSMYVTKAAWPLLRENNYGRVVFTTSAAGLYGNFGQTNYSAAKLGIVGLAKTLAHEGAKYNIKSNVIAPVAKSRMTETIMPPDILNKLLPEYVSAMVGYLCSEGLSETAQIYAVGGGYFARVAVMEGAGAVLPTAEAMNPDAVAAKWSEINDLSKAQAFANAMEAAGAAMKGVMGS
ncbi:MAG: SDR family oxidoreductase [Sorangiineae bacterium]|nr:SDR family oxidoreductase [Polyangiaceae bacterium]MEB2321947.1 SDR family oxidoreductase [Sorangiineae bacterium]